MDAGLLPEAPECNEGSLLHIQLWVPTSHLQESLRYLALYQLCPQALRPQVAQSRRGVAPDAGLRISEELGHTGYRGGQGWAQGTRLVGCVAHSEAGTAPHGRVLVSKPQQQEVEQPSLALQRPPQGHAVLQQVSQEPISAGPHGVLWVAQETSQWPIGFIRAGQEFLDKGQVAGRQHSGCVGQQREKVGGEHWLVTQEGN